jgi:two-component system, LytTR family, response regulator
MKILIVISTIAGREEISEILGKIPCIDHIYSCSSAEEALFTFLEEQPPIVICEEELPNRDGFNFSNMLMKLGLETKFIMLSPNKHKAIDAIRTRLYDFISQPFSPDILIESVNTALQELRKDSFCKQDFDVDNLKIKLTSTNGFLLVDLNLLSHCVAEGSYTNLFFTNGIKECSCFYLGKMEKILEPYQFIRINRSVIVNLRKIHSIDGNKRQCIIETDEGLTTFAITKSCLKYMEDNQIL